MKMTSIYGFNNGMARLIQGYFRNASPEDIADSIGYACLQYLENESKLNKRNCNTILSYLERTAINYMLHLQKEKKRFISLEEFFDAETGEYFCNSRNRGGGADLLTGNEQEIKDFKEVFRSLPEELRNILFWHTVEEVPAVKIAKHLGISKRTVYRKLEEARDILKKELSK